MLLSRSSRLFAETITSSSRCLATLVTSEEFPLIHAVAPKAKPVPVIKESTLANGIKIVSSETGASMTAIRFAIAGGSRYESSSEKGAAHLLAVAAFAGTGKRSGLKLCRDLENLGAIFTSSADREKIVYDLKVASDKVDEAVAAVAEAIAYPPSDSYVVGEMKEIAKIGYKALAANPQLQMIEMLHDAAFGESTPLGASLYAGNLDKLCTDEVMAFRKAHFTAPRITVAASGGVSHDTLKQMVECYLNGVPAEVASSIPASPYQGGDLKFRADLNGETYVGLAFPVPGGEAAKPYSVLHSVLTAKIASMGLSEGQVGSFYAPYVTGGIIGVYASGAPNAAVSSLEAIVAQIKAIATDNTTIIDGHKVRVSLERMSEGENAVDILVAASLRGVSASSLADYRNVTSATVSSAAATALKANPSYAVLGATIGTPSYANIIKLINK